MNTIKITEYTTGLYRDDNNCIVNYRSYRIKLRKLQRCPEVLSLKTPARLTSGLVPLVVRYCSIPTPFGGLYRHNAQNHTLGMCNTQLNILQNWYIKIYKFQISINNLNLSDLNLFIKERPNEFPVATEHRYVTRGQTRENVLEPRYTTTAAANHTYFEGPYLFNRLPGDISTLSILLIKRSFADKIDHN